MRTLCSKSLCDTEARQELVPAWGKTAEGSVEQSGQAWVVPQLCYITATCA